MIDWSPAPATRRLLLSAIPFVRLGETMYVPGGKMTAPPLAGTAPMAA